VASRTVVRQHKTERPVQFEITPATRNAVQLHRAQTKVAAADLIPIDEAGATACALRSALCRPAPDMLVNPLPQAASQH
jgi:hypothetical protein